jgi:hypothetical protein
MFSSREKAGRMLADELSGCRNDPTALILALPRGEVAAGYQLKGPSRRHHSFLGTKQTGQSDGRSMTRTKQRANSGSYPSAVSARRCIARAGGGSSPSGGHHDDGPSSRAAHGEALYHAHHGTLTFRYEKDEALIRVNWHC